MENETFLKLIQILGMTYKQAAEESGFSYATINSIAGNRRRVSPKLEEFVRAKLREHSSDAAIAVILQECGRKE